MFFSYHRLTFPPIQRRSHPMPKSSGLKTAHDVPILAGGFPDTPHGRFKLRLAMREGFLKKETAQAQLAERMMSRLDAVQAYLGDDETWFKKLEKANLRDLAILEGVWIDKLQLVTGKATSMIAHQHQEKLDEVLPLLHQTLRQHGLTIGLSERTIEVKT